MRHQADKLLIRVLLFIISLVMSFILLNAIDIVIDLELDGFGLLASLLLLTIIINWVVSKLFIRNAGVVPTAKSEDKQPVEAKKVAEEKGPATHPIKRRVTKPAGKRKHQK